SLNRKTTHSCIGSFYQAKRSEMPEVMTHLTTEYDLRLVAVAVICTLVLLAAIVVFRGAYARVREQNLQLASALNNMPQGLCMFDEHMRLILCNDRYLEMYSLTREQAYPGCPLRDLLEFRRTNGTFFQDIEDYVAAAQQRVAEGSVFNNVVEVKNHVISIT